MDKFEEIKKRVKFAIKQIAGAIKEDDDFDNFGPLPEVCIKPGDDCLFCFSYPQRKSFIAINRGTKGILITDIEIASLLEHVLVYTFNGHLIEVETKELIFTGYD